MITQRADPRPVTGKIIRHAVLITGLAVGLTLCIVYPFLPGDYDSLALPLSTMAQAFGVLGMPLALIGVSWLAFGRRGWGRALAIAALVAGSLAAIGTAVVGLATSGPALGLLAISVWVVALIRSIRALRAINPAKISGINAAPLYLLILPAAALGAQLALAAPLTDSSRDHAIASSAEMLGDIEAYHAANGRYPAALQAVWKDYYPSVRGIEKYHYIPSGDSYSLVFEQPRFLLDNPGTREFVVFNPRDQHAMISHTSWILILPPAELETSQGWYAVNDTDTPHWRYFWFD
jgi:hypothetical protein